MKLHEHTTSLRASGGKALVAFLTAGYPDEETFCELVRASSRAGCDVIEVGIPFSDPIADGPAIQASSGAALNGGMTLARALELSALLAPELRSALVIMSYINPILRFGLEAFVAAAGRSGVTGIILPDVPVEESSEIRTVVHEGGLDYVDLLAPTSGKDRIARVASLAGGFLYLVSVTGVTGARHALSDDLPAFVERVRAATDVPLYVGFGVSTEDQARQVAQSADGVIIGSRLVALIEDAAQGTDAVTQVESFLTRVRKTINDAV
ncbi:MAG: tryptophan synthase subunit alpha [Candidatus Krumholzibacteriota bacterium]|nr:tryptophan synthase subunit alpha [Candidatus Krumholzibacteriota bacterium]